MLWVPAALAGVISAALGGCNSGAGDCPAKETITPGGACDDEHLQCAYDLPSASIACDGTNAVLATSCTCTKGVWACPSAVECPGSDAATSDEDATGDDGATDASGDDAGDAAESAAPHDAAGAD